MIRHRTTLQRCAVSAEFATGLLASAVVLAQTYGVPAIANDARFCAVAVHHGVADHGAVNFLIKILMLIMADID